MTTWRERYTRSMSLIIVVSSYYDHYWLIFFLFLLSVYYGCWISEGIAVLLPLQVISSLLLLNLYVHYCTMAKVLAVGK